MVMIVHLPHALHPDHPVGHGSGMAPGLGKSGDGKQVTGKAFRFQKHWQLIGFWCR
jgi:hypothetical protein